MVYDLFCTRLSQAESSPHISDLSPSEQARNDVRDLLYERLPHSFPRYGTDSTNIDLLAQIMTVHKDGIGYRMVRCTSCQQFEQQHTTLH